MRTYLKIHEKDNVAVALCNLQKGTEILVDGDTLVLQEDIAVGHKFALSDFSIGDQVIKYGQVIGSMTQGAQKGSWIHSHNLATNLAGISEYIYSPQKVKSVVASSSEFFYGYERADGNVGTRNEIWVIPTVSCVNTTTRAIAEKAAAKYGSLCDGIFAFPHNAGCSQMGNDFEITRRLLASIVRHPNAGGVLLVSLGCENNNLETFLPELGTYDSTRIRTLVTQEADGDEVEEGVRIIKEIVSSVSHDKRTKVPVSKLVIGFKCGGSDAFSGITANPLCGRIANHVVSCEGIGILTEVPEMFGAENILMQRSDSEQTFSRVVELINSFKNYYLSHDLPIYDNPSPGNKEGGITTLEEKSLGCIQKGGDAIVTDSLDFGQAARKPGLNLLVGPGNDSVSITNLLASGAQVLLFTTGRGNPLATAVPTIKISSNSALYERKNGWIDFNAGRILEGESLDAVAERLWKMVLEVISGDAKTKNELHGYREIMIFKDGVLL
ncbi:MAG: altronate dehydratase family protein [Sphaerochaetaceae bacterium]